MLYEEFCLSVGYISQYKTRIVEGELRCKELVKYLETLNSKMFVWLSEDASGVVAKVEFDSKSNQMVGLVLPLNTNTGMPIPFSFMARSADEIQTNMKKNKSSLVYIIMAKLLMKNTPPFILQLFGTNNRFNSHDVLNRWKYTVEELNR